MHTHLQIARFIARLLDTNFSLFGIKFGIDPIVGLIPVLGDIITLGLSAHLLFIAIQAKLPKEKIELMLRNVLIDVALGSVPVVGDIADLFFKANMKNLYILEEFVPKKVITQ